MIPINTIHCGDSLAFLKTLPSGCVDCVVTSPPYWALRDYGVDGQLGLEKSFEEYLDRLILIFQEVHRVLKDTGTCFVNLGDTYFGGDMKAQYLEKCLCMIPARFALRMIEIEWILRNEIVWHKPNAMPSSATDRFTVDFEKIFFFTKSKTYYFEQQLEEYFVPLNRWGGNATNRENSSEGYAMCPRERKYRPNEEGRNKRAVWSINTESHSEAHLAVYPKSLVTTPILAGCPKGGIVLDPFMGSGTTAVVAQENGRKYLGAELNPEYCKIAEKRLRQQPLF